MPDLTSKAIKYTKNAYDKMTSNYSRCWSNDTCMHSRLHKFLNHLPQKGRIVDIGSGTGRDVKFFIDHGVNSVGIDISIEMIKEAKRICPKGEFIAMEMRNLGFPANSFTGIWACASVIHLPKSQIKIVLYEFYRILKKGGILFLSLQKKTQEEGWNEKFVADGRFYAYYNQEEVSILLEKYKFQILYSDFNESRKNTFNESRIAQWINFWAVKI